MNRRLPWLAAAAAGLVLGLVLAGGVFDSGPRDPRPELVEATALYGQERPLPEFELHAHDGSAFDRNRLAGRWTLVFFGYTYCPDVCPMTMSALNSTLQLIDDPKVRDAVQVLFVSVDPKRDTRERLAQYVPYFNRDFIGATGAVEQIERLTGALGAVYQLREPDASGAYLIDHSSRVLLIDPRARFAAVLSDRSPPKILAADLQTIVHAYGG